MTTEPSPAPGPAPSPTPSPSPTPGPAATRPDWLPEAHWDATASSIKPDFGKHYVDLSARVAEIDKRAAARPEKPELYKPDLPADFKPPEGVTIKFDDKDPIRGPILAEARTLAHEIGVDQPTFSRLLGLQAKLELAQHNAAVTAETERVAGEMKALGEKAKDRIAAIENWGKGLVDRKDISQAEYAELQAIGSSAAGVSLIEKLIAKASGTVPGAGGNPPSPPKPAEVRPADRWYGATQQKAS